MSYALSVTLDQTYETTIQRVREALTARGFGILTEIDIAATLKAKLGATVAPQVILGACNPPLAHAALQVEPSIGLLLPCNVVVRAAGENTTIVQAVNPQTMVALTGNTALQSVADDATRRLEAALDSLTRRTDGAAPPDYHQTDHQPAQTRQRTAQRGHPDARGSNDRNLWMVLGPGDVKRRTFPGMI